MEHSEHHPHVTSLMLQPPVRCLLNSPTAEILTWEITTLHSGTLGLHTGGVYHIRGLAQEGAITLPWSLVLKIVCPPSPAAQAARTPFRIHYSHHRPTSLFYWQREAQLFQSDVLVDLAPTLAAPQCYGVSMVSTDAVWLWLEHIVDHSPSEWGMSEYALAADALGVFSGSYLGNRPVPSARWLATDFLRRFAVCAAPAVAHLAHASAHPLLGRLYPHAVANRVTHLWQQRHRLFHALDQLPQTFCHFDSHRGNLLMPAAPTGSHFKVIDWATAGTGPLGADAGMLMGVATQRTVFTQRECENLDLTIFSQYLLGLRRAGWQGEDLLVRFGYTATIALRIVIGYLPDDLHTWLHGSWFANVEAQTGSPISDFADRVAVLVAWLVACGEEALALVPRIENQLEAS